MTRMTQATLNSVIESHITHSTWFEAHALQENHRAALDSYYGRNKPKKTDGLSGAVSQDVADMVEAVVAQVIPAFDFDELAKWVADGANDVDQARVETLVTNDVFRHRNPGYTLVQEAVRNALVLRNGILKIYPEEVKDVRFNRFEGLDALELADATKQVTPEQTREVTSAKRNKADDELMDVTVKTTTVHRRLTVESTDPINFLLTEEYDSIDLQLAPMCGERYFLSVSDLIMRGVPRARVNKLPSIDSDNRIVTRSRDRGEASNPVMLDHGDDSRRMIEVFELYVLIDFDGDGISERRRILYAGGTSGGDAIQNWPTPRVPYASGTGWLQPQRWVGLSMYDKLREIEEIKTEALRQYLDNLAFANNAELIVVDGAVEIEDLKARRPGGINRVDDIAAVRELVVQDLGPSSLALLNYMDQVRSERGGASLDLQSAQLQVAGETAHGIERQFTSKEALARLITRTLAETMVRQAFKLIHAVLREDFPDQAEQQVGSQFVAYSPGQWKARDKLEIVAGMSFNERAERRSALESVLIQQEKLHSAGLGGGILTDLRTYHDTLIDWTAAGGVSNARRYWVDPRSPESIDAQKKSAEAAQQAQAAQQFQTQQFLETQQEIESDKIISGLVQEEAKLSFDYWKATLDSATQEQTLDAQYDTSESEPGQVDELQDEGTQRAATN